MISSLLYNVNMEQHTQFEMLLQLRMLDAGLVPHTSIFSDVLKEVKAYMATLEPTERRKSARKFRKMWRRAAANYMARVSSTKGLNSIQRRRRPAMMERARDRVEQLYCDSAPTKRQLRRRSEMVLEMFLRQLREEMARSKAQSSRW